MRFILQCSKYTTINVIFETLKLLSASSKAQKLLFSIGCIVCCTV